MFPQTDFMVIDGCVEMPYANKPRRIGIFSLHFLTAEPRTQRVLFLETNPPTVPEPYDIDADKGVRSHELR